jgi:hypothetical protein
VASDRQRLLELTSSHYRQVRRTVDSSSPGEVHDEHSPQTVAHCPSTRAVGPPFWASGAAQREFDTSIVLAEERMRSGAGARLGDAASCLRWISSAHAPSALRSWRPRTAGPMFGWHLCLTPAARGSGPRQPRGALERLPGGRDGSHVAPRPVFTIMQRWGPHELWLSTGDWVCARVRRAFVANAGATAERTWRRWPGTHTRTACLRRLARAQARWSGAHCDRGFLRPPASWQAPRQRPASPARVVTAPRSPWQERDIPAGRLIGRTRAAPHVPHMPAAAGAPREVAPALRPRVLSERS